ncbi:hypothetical protein R1sor_023608 [Riccia sorocarpa]|uniref:Uncharacterized protein n=1 Tax=Riccia sorocarpa TaxID=122646 RepID=A0ABD3GQA1_9MARC
MAQVFEDKGTTGGQLPARHEVDPLHEVKDQIESGVGTIKSEPLFEGAKETEKFPESRVGETLLTDDARKLDSVRSMVTDEQIKPSSGDVVKSEVADTFANEYKENNQQADAGSSGVEESQGNNQDDEQRGMKFKKLSAAGIPRGKPHFRVSANHGNRGLGDNSSFPTGGGNSGGGGLRGNLRGGIARTGSGLARTGSGIPQGNNELKDFSAALFESEKVADSPVPSTTDSFGKHNTGESLSDNATKTKDATGEKLSSGGETTGEKLTSLKDTVTDKAIAAKDVLVEKAGDLKTGIVETLKDQLLPVKDGSGSGKMDVDSARVWSALGTALGGHPVLFEIPDSFDQCIGNLVCFTGYRRRKQFCDP